MGRACNTNGEPGTHEGFPVGKPEGNRPLRRPRRRWEDNIKMDLREIGRCCMDWITYDLRRRPVEGSCEHGNESSGSIKCCKILIITERLAASQEGLSSMN